MKNLLILLLLSPTISFPISPIYATSVDSIPRTVKEWCLAINEQNKDLIRKVNKKDSIQRTLEAIHRSDTIRIASYKRDSVSWEISERASREAMVRKDTIITNKEAIIKKRTKERNGVVFIGLLYLVYKGAVALIPH